MYSGKAKQSPKADLWQVKCIFLNPSILPFYASFSMKHVSLDGCITDPSMSAQEGEKRKQIQHKVPDFSTPLSYATCY